MFIHCCLSGKADFLVTGDNDLLVLKDTMPFKILKARDFLKLAATRATLFLCTISLEVPFRIRKRSRWRLHKCKNYRCLASTYDSSPQKPAKFLISIIYLL